ncbi:MAG: hypothetical protein ABSC06_33005 [Rhodopila sp.]|jgi:hypothetical protein
MYLAIPPQSDCFSAWREAVRLVDNEPEHQAYNVIIDVADPVARSSCADPAVAAVDVFLTERAKKPARAGGNRHSRPIVIAT